MRYFRMSIECTGEVLGWHPYLNAQCAGIAERSLLAEAKKQGYEIKKWWSVPHIEGWTSQRTHWFWIVGEIAEREPQKP